MKRVLSPRELTTDDRFLNKSALILALLDARRRAHVASAVVTVYAVLDRLERVVDSGHPSTWKPGVAQLVLQGVYHLDEVSFEVHGSRYRRRRRSSSASAASGLSTPPPGPALTPEVTSKSPLTGLVQSLSDTALLGTAAVAGQSSSSSSEVARSLSSSSSVDTSPPRRPRSLDDLPAWTALDEEIMENVVYGVTCDRGARSKMEDAHSIRPDFDQLITKARVELAKLEASGDGSTLDQPLHKRQRSSVREAADTGELTPHAFFGVYDGHGGREAADFVEGNLHLRVAECIAAGDRISAALSNGFAAVDEDFLAICAERAAGNGKLIESGATALCMILNGTSLHVAHAGDCRAVLCRDGDAVTMTQDHKANDFQEEIRIQHAGGFVEFGYVGGELECARSIGDFRRAQPERIDEGGDPEDARRLREMGPGKLAGLTSEPVVTEFFLQKQDEFIIIGCDGLWDRMKAEEAVAFARRSLQLSDDIQLTSRELVQEAIRKGSEDNITCVVIGFPQLDPSTGGRKVCLSHRVHRAPSSSRKPRPIRLGSGANQMLQLLLGDEEEDDEDGDEDGRAPQKGKENNV